MSRRFVVYKDDKIIQNGTTTVALGHAEMNQHCELYSDLEKILDEIYHLEMVVHFARGVSKLHPEDTYDELSGKIVASKKAEISALKQSKKDLLKLKRFIDMINNDIHNEITAIDHRVDNLLADKH